MGARPPCRVGYFAPRPRVPVKLGPGRRSLIRGRRTGGMNEESLFAAALERTGADREAFLDEACGGDTRLRGRVERLLAADERGRGILDQGPGALAAVAPGRTDAPTQY